jgi:hypothetical protein
MVRILFVFGLLLLPASSALAQNPADSLRPSPRVVAPGVVVTTDTLQPASTPRIADSLRPSFKSTIVPRRATIKSLILPGLGQAYIKQYWTIPVIYAGFGALGYAVYWNQTRYKRFLNAFAAILPLKYNTDKNGNLISSVKNPNATVPVEYAGQQRDFTEEQIISIKNFHRRNRDLSYIGIAALWGMNILEANVSAHLKTFDESDDISWRITPGAQNQFAQTPLGATLTLNFSSKPPKPMRE